MISEEFATSLGGTKQGEVTRPIDGGPWTWVCECGEDGIGSNQERAAANLYFHRRLSHNQ